jgi:glycerol uptake facilitator-like aquaporin
MSSPVVPLRRRVAAEGIGTGLLVAVVVGSGIQADRLTEDGGVALLANSLATVLGLGVLIAVLGPISGAHFNPVVTLAAWWNARRDGSSAIPGREVAVYGLAQVGGAIGGAVLANAMFAEPLARWSLHHRDGAPLWLAEIVATAGLVVVVFGLSRTGRAHLASVAVACYIGAAYWFTASTSFANPAVTIGRAFTDTYAGIAPASVGGFVLAQLVGAVIGLGVLAVVFGPPATPRSSAAITTAVPLAEQERALP